MTHPLPRQAAPELSVPTVSGELWSLDTCSIDSFLMVVFYRHQNCGVCQSYLSDLSDKLRQFEELGVSIAAVSMDTAAGAKNMASRLQSTKLTMGYDLRRQTAEDWGLYVSAARKPGEPTVFTEPGLFLIDRSRRLYFASTQSMPFGRTSFDSLLEWIPKLVSGSIPARGELEQGAA